MLIRTILIAMIHITLKGLHIQLTDAIKNYTHDKFSICEKFITGTGFLTIELRKTSDHHKIGEYVFMIEASLDAQRNRYSVSETGADLYGIIDSAKERLIEQVKQGKGKRHTLTRRGHMILKKIMKQGWY